MRSIKSNATIVVVSAFLAIGLSGGSEFYGKTPHPLIVRSAMKATDPFFQFGKDEQIILILDASKSMTQTVDGVHERTYLLKMLVKGLLDLIDPVRVQLIIYGMDVSQSYCEDASVVVEFGSTRPAFEKVMRNYKPKRSTPLTYALQLAGWQIPNQSGNKRVILITDGWDSCGNNPVEAKEMLITQGFKVQIMNIGYDRSVTTLASSPSLYKQFLSIREIEALSEVFSKSLSSLESLVYTPKIFESYEKKGMKAATNLRESVKVTGKDKFLSPKHLGRINKMPVYPFLAKKQGQEGIVSLELFIDAAGQVQDVLIVKSSRFPILDNTALTALRGWLFAPGRVNGKLSAGIHRINIRFSLSGEVMVSNQD